MRLELMTFALSARRSADWANGPLAERWSNFRFYATRAKIFTFEIRSGNATMSVPLSLSFSSSIAFFSRFERTCHTHNAQSFIHSAYIHNIHSTDSGISPFLCFFLVGGWQWWLCAQHKPSPQSPHLPPRLPAQRHTSHPATRTPKPPNPGGGTDR